MKSEWEKKGYLEESEVELPSWERLKKGSVAIIECPQEIPCDPCKVSCPNGAIELENLNALPKVNFDLCNGCGLCVQKCPGLAIFLLQFKGEGCRVTLPYEFLPLPKKGEKVIVLNRKGEEVGEGTIVGVLSREKSRGDTTVITVEVEKKLGNKIRNIKRKNR
jgi:Fe-S-cluster-containing hydrogenase component 2